MPVRIRLLGPLTIERDGTELTGPALGGVRERRLLAILALASGDVVAKDVIIERLWDQLPKHPAAAVDTAVSLARRALGSAGEALVTQRPGYCLRCPTDVADVEQLVAAGKWDEAVALWDGELLASDPGSEWIEGQRRELARRRVDVLVGAAESAAARGDDATALQRFSAALAIEPLREDGHRGQMASLARLGRPAEALRAYERCRRMLREELGTDPSAQTLALFEQILGGRTPERAAVAPRTRSSIGLLGRGLELARLTTAGSRCEVRVVFGESGVGKSRLLDEALAVLGAQEVRATKCFRLVAPVPYAVLADLAPELLPDGEGSVGAAAGHAARLAAQWSEALAGRAVTLVIDDLQWADEPSLAVLGLVLRRRPPDLRLLLAARQAELAPDGAARQLLDLATGLGVVDTVTLRPLTLEEVVAGGYTFEDWKRTGGHPLLFTEWVRGGGDDLAALVLHRAAATGVEAIELVRAAAILDRGAPLADLASLAELTPAAARVAAERLGRHALLVEQGGLWRVPHDVIAELIQADLAPVARRRWHRRVLAQLEASGAAPAELAHHALGAGDHTATIDHSLAAGDRALETYANREAVEHYGRARELLEAGPSDEQPTVPADGEGLIRRAVLGEARALIVLARTDAARALVERLPTTTGRQQVERLLVEADCGWAAWKPTRALAPAEEALRLAVELGDDELEGRVHAFIANPYGSLGRLDEAMGHIDATLELAGRRGRPPPAIVMYRLGLIHHQRGREVEALAALAKCHELALVEHDERALVFERVVRAWALGALGRYGEALAVLDDVSAIGRGEEAVVRGRVPNTRASLLFDLGLVEMALDADEESLEITRGEQGAGVVEPQIQTLLNLATDHLHLDDPDRAGACLTEVEALAVEAEYARFRFLNRYHWVQGLLHLHTGELDTALDDAALVAAMAGQFEAPKYLVRAGLLRGLVLARRAGEHDRALAELRDAAARAEQYGFAALAERAHRGAADLLGGGGRHAREADQWRARIVGSVEGPLRALLR